MTTSKIIHLTSCCGAGKSHNTMSALPNLIDQKIRSGEEFIVVVASITLEVSKQNFNTFARQVKHLSLNIDHALIDSSNSIQVQHDLDKYLSVRSKAVVFITHLSAAKLDARHLRRSIIIFDEAPTSLVKTINLTYEVISTQHYPWEDFLIRTPVQGKSKLAVVSLNPAIPKSDIQRYLDGIHTGINNVVTPEVANMLAFLLEDHENLYFTKLEPDKVFHVYTGIDWLALHHLTSNCIEICILSAGLKDLALGHIFEHVAKTPIQVVSPNWLPHPLQTKHKKPAIIYPLLKGAKWSGEIKKSVAVSTLSGITDSDYPDETVYSYFLRLAKSKLGNNFLLIKNVKKDIDNMDSSLEVEAISPKKHGSNAYTNYHHAAFLASMRPNPYEEYAYKQFAQKHGITNEAISKALIVERCHEACYQSIARTSLRLQNHHLGEPHMFIVPDEDYAAYVASWFEPGYATIDTSLAHRRKPSEKKDGKHTKNIMTAAQILIDNMAGKGTKKSLCQQAGVPVPTFEYHCKRYKPQLQEMGLIN